MVGNINQYKFYNIISLEVATWWFFDSHQKQLLPDICLCNKVPMTCTKNTKCCRRCYDSKVQKISELKITILTFYVLSTRLSIIGYSSTKARFYFHLKLSAGIATLSKTDYIDLLPMFRWSQSLPFTERYCQYHLSFMCIRHKH
jgi:hypothetical protein